MKVSVVFATPQKQTLLSVELPEGATVQQALDASAILKKRPEIDADTLTVGVWGKAVKLDAVLEEGARVEIYRPITCDPKTVKRRNAPEASA